MSWRDAGGMPECLDGGLERTQQQGGEKERSGKECDVSLHGFKAASLSAGIG